MISNKKPPRNVLKTGLGLIEERPTPTDEELRVPKPVKKKEVGPSVADLQSQINIKNMENEALTGVNSNLVGENLALKHKLIDLNNQKHDMKLAVKALSNGNKQELESIKLMFLSKKTQLINIINSLKKKINSMNGDVNFEINVRDAMLHREQDATRRLKGEIVKAKDVLMSTELSIQAHQDLKKLISINEEDRVFLEDGSIRDLLDNQKMNQQTFEFEKKKDFKEDRAHKKV